jgi:PAS domain S-box-containing protein
MTLRRSILAFTGGMILIMGLISTAFMWQLMTGALSDLEEAYVHQEVEATLFYIREDLASLKRVGGDWAPWDDTRDFVMGEDEDYVQNNLDDWTFSNLGTDFMIFYDGSGDLFYSRAFDPTTGEVVSAPEVLLNLERDDPLLAHSSPEDAMTGIIADQKGLLMVSSHPITGSRWNDRASETPIAGTLIVGHHLDEARVAELGSFTGLALRMEPLAPAREVRDLTSTDPPLQIEMADEETIIASKAIEDIYGDLTILFEARLPREIHRSGMEIVHRMALAIGLFSLFVGGAILFFLERSLLNPLATITSSVEAIRRTEEPYEFHIPKAGRGELANLAKSINEMLDRLETYHQKLRYSEERLRAIFDTAQDCIFIKDRESRYVQVNPMMERIFGMPASEILGNKDEVLFSPETAVQIRDADAQVLSGDIFVGEVARDTSEGDSITFHVVKVPLRDDRGQVVGICGIARDITYLKYVESELQKRGELLSASAFASYTLLTKDDIDRVIIEVLQLLGEAVEADRAYIFENHHTEDGKVFMNQLYEWEKEDVEPQINNPNLQNLPYHPDNASFYETISRGLPYKGLIKDLPETERASLEPQGIVSILIVPILAQGQLWGFIGFDDCRRERAWSNNEISVLQVAAGIVGGAIIRSRTRMELVRAKEELQERIGEVEAKNAEMERFVYTVSHDLRSPLVTIQGFVGFLREDLSAMDRDKVETDLWMIEDAVFKMDHLLKDTLKLSRVGRVVNPPEEVYFGDIVEGALKELSDKTRSKNVRIILPESWPSVRVDRLRIEEVLKNLVENGIKYMGEERNPEIEMGWREAGGETVFFVRDNGIGIEREELDKVFDLFYKLNPESEGSGVGLAIVKRIIEVHGGRIWAEPGEEKGTTFLFTLPRAGR